MEFPQRLIPGSSGAILNCSHTPVDNDKPGILIAIPFGVPVTVAHAAFERFGADFNVVTWESRFILNLDQQFSGNEKLEPDKHVEDMLCLLRALEIDACHLIGYCSGAGISLLAARQFSLVSVGRHTVVQNAAVSTLGAGKPMRPLAAQRRRSGGR